MWFIFALITTLSWGAADLLYKLGADEKDRFSHLKTTVAVGIVMGLHAVFTLIFGGISYDFRNIIIYLPVSAMYILSMTVGYFGLRYLELSISSPIQNASGAVTCILCLVILGQSIDALSGVAVIAICLGVILLGVFEKRESDITASAGERKYRIGFAAIIIPVIYCVIDSLGTFFDAWYLDDIETTPLRGVTADTLENVANISYELTFLVIALLLSVYIFVIKRDKSAASGGRITAARFGAAAFETGGQLAYVFAMSGNGVVAAPMIASYCIVSVILSRILLKEKLRFRQYICVALVMAGILLLGISEGLAE